MEKENDIEILYACELGSRVWGFSNDQSDYNVRFIFKRSNVRDYLALKKRNDVIECFGDDFNIIGWDIKKALEFHYRDNSNLRECLLSDIVYIDKGIEDYFSGLGGFNIDVLKNNYYAKALVGWRQYISLEFNRTKSKKYLHVIRSILIWNLLDREVCPPININELVNHKNLNLRDDIKQSINDLISYHQSSGSLSEDAVFRLNNFILSSLKDMDKVKVKSFKDIRDYDKRFRQVV